MLVRDKYSFELVGIDLYVNYYKRVFWVLGSVTL